VRREEYSRGSVAMSWLCSALRNVGTPYLHRCQDYNSSAPVSKWNAREGSAATFSFSDYHEQAFGMLGFHLYSPITHVCCLFLVSAGMCLRVWSGRIGESVTHVFSSQRVFITYVHYYFALNQTCVNEHFAHFLCNHISLRFSVPSVSCVSSGATILVGKCAMLPFRCVLCK
jgi:hypothetical protein